MLITIGAHLVKLLKAGLLRNPLLLTILALDGYRGALALELALDTFRGDCYGKLLVSFAWEEEWISWTGL